MNTIRQQIPLDKLRSLVYDMIAVERRLPSILFWSKTANCMDSAIGWLIMNEHYESILPNGDICHLDTDCALEAWNDWYDEQQIQGV